MTASSPSQRTRSRRGARTKAGPAKPQRHKPGPRRRPAAAAKRNRGAKGATAANPVTLALKRFAQLLRVVESSATTLTKEQRSLLKRAIKHAHAALD